MTRVLKSALAALLTAGAITVSLSAQAQRGRDWREDRGSDSRYDDRRYDPRYHDRYGDRYGDRYDDRYDGPYGDRYDRGRGSIQAIRRLADRAEELSNEFRDQFERYEKDRDSWYRDNGSYYGDNRGRYDDRDYRYRADDRYRDDRYRDSRRRDDRHLSDLKPYVQRMDESLERLRHETDSDRGLSESRRTMADVLRNARALDRAFGSGSRGRGGQLNSRWVRVRSVIDQLASAYGMQRI